MTRTWEGGASAAAAAGISRVLAAGGVKRSVEMRRGMESQGYVAMPKGDHVRVEYNAGPFVPDDQARIAEGLSQCERVLEARGYKVTRAIAEVSEPGGWHDGEVLEVRP